MSLSGMAEPPPPCEAAETDMCGNMHKIDHLRREIARRETELAELKSRLAVAESEERAQKQQHERDDDGGGETAWRWPLEEHDYERYGRQMIVPGFGLQGALLSVTFSWALSRQRCCYGDCPSRR